MIIYHNMPALRNLNTLNQNVKNGEKSANRLSTGEKFHGAGMNSASEYQISERMRVKLRGLGQCVDNVEKGGDMLNTASGAVDQQVEIMKRIREVSMRASDDTYSDIDREALQSEVNHLLDEIESLAQDTTYNGLPLLNQSTLTRRDFFFDPDAPYRAIPSSIPVIPEAAANSNGKYTVPQGTYANIAIAGVNGATITNAYDPTSYTRGAAMTSLPRAGDWVCDLAGIRTQVVLNGGILCYGAGGTTPIEVGGIANGTLPPAASTNVYSVVYSPLTAMPAVGATVCDAAGNNRVVKAEPGSGAISMFISGGSTSIMEIDFASLIGAVGAPQGLDELGFSLDCGGCNQFVTVKFDSSTTSSHVYGGNPNSGTTNPICYVIGVGNVTNAQQLAETMFNGLAASNGTFTGTVPSANNETVRIASAHDIKMNYYAATGKFTISKNGPNMTYLNGIKGEMYETDYYQPYQDIYLQTETASNDGQFVRVHNTTLNALFPPFKARWDISPKESDFPTEWPKGYEWNKEKNRPMTEVEKRMKWTQEIWKYPADRVDLKGASVATRKNASQFIDQVDQALKYLLYTNTRLGAQTSRLEYVEANLTTSHENTTASESTIRDADMAKEVVNNVKYNILRQSAQAMLSQSNAEPQSILSLIQ